jgi:hypothetical protein|tara:strand:- start:2353 stop:3456 length:1104 start_codon:yes stop_codon:yes gene_type:complete
MKQKVLKIDQFLRDRVVVDKIDNSISKNEKKFILQIFRESDFLKNKFSESLQLDISLKLIDSNFEYDSYFFSYGSLSFVLKVNEDDETGILKKEFDILKKIKRVAPTAIHYEKVDETVDILLTSYENGTSFKNVSVSDLFENAGNVASHLAFLHKSTQNKEELETSSFLEEIFALTKYEETLPEDRYQGLTKTARFENHLPTLERIKEKILLEINSIDQSYNCICHTNINKSRILRRNDELKFTNFLYASNLDPMWDLALSIYYLGFSNYPTTEKEFVDKYIESRQDIEISKEDFFKKLKTFKKVAYKLILIKILALYFYEIIIFGSDRPSKIVELIRIYEGLRDEFEMEFPLHLKNIDDIFYNYSL